MQGNYRIAIICFESKRLFIFQVWYPINAPTGARPVLHRDAQFLAEAASLPNTPSESSMISSPISRVGAVLMIFPLNPSLRGAEYVRHDRGVRALR
jgi:hypothetical protein